MKHNLANKPQLYKIPSDLTEHLKFETQIIEWFEGFEKQETDQERYLRLMPEATTQHMRDKIRAYEKHMKEILGEASSQEGSVKYSARS